MWLIPPEAIWGIAAEGKKKLQSPTVVTIQK